MLPAASGGSALPRAPRREAAMTSRAAALLRSVRQRRELLQRLSHANTPTPPAPSPASLRAVPPPHASTRGIVIPGPGSWVSGAQVHVSTAPAAAVRALQGTRGAIVGVVGDSTMLIRGGSRWAGEKAAEALRAAARRVGGDRAAVAAGPRLMHAAGMGLTAAITREEREEDRGLSQGLLRMLSSTKGPQRIGIGLLSEDLRRISGQVLVHSTLAVCAYVAWSVPAAWPWLAVFSLIAYATRPDRSSFRQFLRDRAPDVARRKTELFDRLRARLAPYMMGLCDPPVVHDYNFFTLISVRDYADYVYVYFGFLGRWLLLGWYNAEQEYNFDAIKSRSS